MFNDITKHLLEALKLAPKYLIAIVLVLSCLLFIPAQTLQLIGIADIAKDYRTGVGIGFLACCALLIVSMGHWIFNVARNLVGGWQFNRHIRQCLGRLTEDEKQILRYYVGKQTRSNRLRFDDGVVQGLAGKHVIFRASNLGNAIEGFAYNINDVAWDVLHENPALLDGVTKTYRTDKRDYGW